MKENPMTTRKRKPKKTRRRSPATKNRVNQPRRLPAPQVTLNHLEINAGSPIPNEDNPLVNDIVQLHAELCRVSQRAPFTIWLDFLDSTESWLRLVGTVGEVGAMAGLPAEVQQKYDRLDQIYTRASVHHPAAYRKMGETFTTIFRLVADAYPAIDLERCGRPGQLSPDILGQAFIASLGYPQTWLNFFPAWSSCIALARDIVPDNAAETIYNELGQAHLRAHLDGVDVDTPQPGEDDTWGVWLEAIKPYYEPPLVGPGVIFSSTMLLALASRFPAWIVRNGLIRFVWPDIVADPVLNNLTSITAMLYGLNGFYADKFQGNRDAIAHIEAVINEEASTISAATSPHPTAVYRREADNPQAVPQEQPPHIPTHPSFSDLFKGS
jgi:hypothetical protein